MFVAAWTSHRKNGFFSAGGGWEYELVLAVSAVVVALIGAGRISLDYLLLHGAGFAGVLAGWWGFAIALVLA